MIELILAFWLALWPGNNTPSYDENGTPVMTTNGDTGDETGHTPPPPPPPPPRP